MDNFARTIFARLNYTRLNFARLNFTRLKFARLNFASINLERLNPTIFISFLYLPNQLKITDFCVSRVMYE